MTSLTCNPAMDSVACRGWEHAGSLVADQGRRRVPLIKAVAHVEMCTSVEIVKGTSRVGSDPEHTCLERGTGQKMRRVQPAATLSEWKAQSKPPNSRSAARCRLLCTTSGPSMCGVARIRAAKCSPSLDDSQHQSSMPSRLIACGRQVGWRSPPWCLERCLERPPTTNDHRRRLMEVRGPTIRATWKVAMFANMQSVRGLGVDKGKPLGRRTVPATPLTSPNACLARLGSRAGNERPS
jgi:hypothetical protein